MLKGQRPGIESILAQWNRFQLNPALTPEQIFKISAGFSHDFRSHKLLSDSKDDSPAESLISHDWYYDFNSFFEFAIFAVAADFNPHFKLGKRPIAYQVEIAEGGDFSEDLLSMLGFPARHFLFGQDGSGIEGWITAEELELIWGEREFFPMTVPGGGESPRLNTEFLDFVERLHRASCGIIAGVEMRERANASLTPPGIVPAHLWENPNDFIIRFE